MFDETEKQQLNNILSRLTPEEYETLRIHFTLNKASITQNRSSFTSDEDEKLRALVKIYGERNWSEVAAHIPGRTTRQCRERYRHYLSPNIINGEWTEAEDQLLKEKYQEFGPKWVSISKFFGTRTDINVKNRWIVLMRRNATIKSTESSPIAVETKQSTQRQAHYLPMANSNLLIETIKTQPINDSEPFMNDFDAFTEWTGDTTIELI